MFKANKIASLTQKKLASYNILKLKKYILRIFANIKEKILSFLEERENFKTFANIEKKSSFSFFLWSKRPWGYLQTLNTFFLALVFVAKKRESDFFWKYWKKFSLALVFVAEQEVINLGSSSHETRFTSIFYCCTKQKSRNRKRKKKKTENKFPWDSLHFQPTLRGYT